MSKKVLVVDDEVRITEYLQKLLTKWGYEVITANDGSEALQKADTEKPDVILMDIKMPGLDGMSACSEITTAYSIPVIIMTGVGDENTKADSFVLGAFEYIEKPLDDVELKTIVEEAIKHGKDTH